MTTLERAGYEDAELAARDRGLAGLSLALDGDVFAELLDARLHGVRIAGARATYVRYKPGTSCLVAHRVRIAESAPGSPASIDVYARVERRDQFAKLAKVAQRAVGSSCLGPGGLLFEDLGMAVYLFPNDRRLRSLGRLTGGDGRSPLLERLLPDRPELWEAEVHRLSYKPERRFVAAVMAGGRPHAVVRAYDEGFRRALRSTGACAAAQVGVPAVLGASRRHRTVVLGWLEGRPLDGVLDHDPSRAESAGEALAALHASKVSGLPAWTAGHEAARLDAAAEAVAATLPRLGEPARALGRRLAAAVERTDAPAVPVHGDFSADQVVVGPGGPGLIDLDRSMAAAPVVDLASFTAALERDVISARRSPSAAGTARERFLAAYESTAPEGVGLPDHRVAAALLRLAPEPFRRREPDWAGRTAAIVERAAELAAA